MGDLGQQAAGLGQGLDHQHAGHDRVAGEVAVEEGLVAAHALDGEHALVGFQLEHAVDQQERIAVRQQLLDRRHVERELQGLAHLVFRPLTHVLCSRPPCMAALVV
ncbi:hypothetical protein D3C71_1842360 [compost metagenome]